MSVTTEKAPSVLDRAVKELSLICLGVLYFANEEDAQAAHAEVRARGDRYNGGWFDGLQCGREPSRDHVDPELGKVYAVTTR